MKAELEEIAGIARGASEREIETEVVYVLKRAGWPRSQINQDVPISDKGADKADIVLKLDDQPVVLIEVKKHGHSRDADNQVNRYCRLLRPSPKLALLTDGVRWVLYYVGQVGAIPIQEASVPNETASVVSMLNLLGPESLTASLHTGVFQFLDIAEQGLQERSAETQKYLRSYFASTVKSLLMPHGSFDNGSILAEVTPRVDSVPAEKQSEPTRVELRQLTQPEIGTHADYDPSQPPSLVHTSVIAASFAADTATNWNDLLRVAVKTALATGHSKHEIQRITGINLQEGNIEDKGFSPITGTGLSLQGQSAGQAWQNSLTLAQVLGCVIEAKFRWQNKEKALHPGESGLLRWQP